MRSSFSGGNCTGAARMLRACPFAAPICSIFRRFSVCPGVCQGKRHFHFSCRPVRVLLYGVESINRQQSHVTGKTRRKRSTSVPTTPIPNNTILGPYHKGFDGTLACLLVPFCSDYSSGIQRHIQVRTRHNLRWCKRFLHILKIHC